MKLYCEKEDSTMHIDEEDLTFLGKQLVNLVYLYRNEIVIPDDNTSHALETLNMIGNMILHKQYHELINDPRIIEPSNRDELTDNWYLNATRR